MLLISQHHHKDKNTKTRIKQQNYSFETMNNDNVKKMCLFRKIWNCTFTLDWNAVMNKIITSNNTIKLLRLYEIILNPFLRYFFSALKYKLVRYRSKIARTHYQISVGHYIMI